MNNLAELEAFVAIVETGGYTEAAKRLRKSKSAISKHMTALEGRLGVTLLNRTTRQVSATDIGTQYYNKVTTILADLNGADDMVRSLQSAPQGTLTVSVGTDLGNTIVLPMVVEFMRAYPDVQINLLLDNRFVNLAEENIDLAIRVGNLSDSSLKARKLANTQFGIVGSPDYFTEHTEPTLISDLSKHDLLFYGRGQQTKFWTLLDRNGEERHIRGETQLSINDGVALKQASQRGMGLSLVPCFLYADALNDGSLVKVLSDLPVNEVGVYALYKPVQYTQPKLRAFIDFLTDAFKSKGNENWV